MIERGVSKVADQQFDLIVIGGGVYGASLLLEASRRGLRALLLESEDFGGATSWNSLRIIHGGLRYLQTLDLRRFSESVRETRWFLRTFPDLVQPLKCLLPLYGDGLQKPAAFRAALLLGHLLTRRLSLDASQPRLPRGEVVDAHATASLFPPVDRQGLQGGGVWYDAVMVNSQRVVMEMLYWACANGAVALNYAECREPWKRNGRLAGVRAIDRVTGTSFSVGAPVVINCAGPWCRDVASRLDHDPAHAFRPSLAFNLLFDVPAPSACAVAAKAKHTGARTYFLVPYHNRLLAGTFHATWQGGVHKPRPTPRQIELFLDDLAMAVPDLHLKKADIVRVYSGLLPVKTEGTVALSTRETIVDHRIGGLEGLWTVSGVKFTTARLVAEKTLHRVFASQRRDLRVRRSGRRPSRVHELDYQTPPSPSVAVEVRRRRANAILRLTREESVVYLEDLLLRRTDWARNSREVGVLTAQIRKEIGERIPARTAALVLTEV